MSAWIDEERKPEALGRSHLQICHTNPHHTLASKIMQKINVTSVQKPTQNACKKNMSCQNQESQAGKLVSVAGIVLIEGLLGGQELS